ncbi:MAG: hypothetical protein CNCCGFBP_00221 [Fimbriimonadaceae bacterium]|nr:hypothetical protein [Fimbriimonadaceae bacterium]
MTENPPDVQKWLVEGTVADVRSVLAGYLYDGADLDDSDVADIRRSVVCDSIILGLTRSQVLLSSAYMTRLPKTTSPDYYYGVMERSLPIKRPPLCFLDDPLRVAAKMAADLDKQVAKKLGMTWLYVTAIGSVNAPGLPQIEREPS